MILLNSCIHIFSMSHIAELAQCTILMDHERCFGSSIRDRLTKFGCGSGMASNICSNYVIR